jgi:hypothetical protein
VNSYFFEIVERAFGRFSWILVVYRKGRRRVIARANRDYRTSRKAAKAARRLKQIVGSAKIVFAFPPTPDFTFEVLRDVLALPVGSPESADAARGQPHNTALVRGRSATSVPAPQERVAAAAGTTAPARATPAAEDKLAAPAAEDKLAAPAAEDKLAAPAVEDKPVRSKRVREQAAPQAQRGRRAARATARS